MGMGSNQPFIFNSNPWFVQGNIYDDLRNDVYGYGGGSEALYVTDLGPSISGGVNAPLNISSMTTSPTIIGQMLDSMPPWVWLLVIAGAIYYLTNE